MRNGRLSAEKKNRAVFLAGLIAVLLTVIPTLLLGEDAIFTYHDQLDGEVIAYVLQARHLFCGDALPEFMNGASKTALTMPAPAFVLLFLTGNACFALTVMLFFGRFFGYVGMYLLAKEVTENGEAAAVAGVLFGWLPFLPVYGLSQFGIPMLFWCALQLKKRRYVVCAFLYTALYALTSSLVLVGFGVLGMGVLWLIWCARRQKKALLRTFGAWLLLLGIYIAENFRLLAELLGIGEATVSHKAEYVLAADSFSGLLGQYLTKGGQHSEDYHLWLSITALGLLLLSFAFRTARTKALQKSMGVCLGWNALFVLTAAVWDSAPGIWLRGRLSVLGAFQLDRLLWIAPCFRYLFFACAIAIGAEIFARRSRAVGGIALTVISAAALVTGGQILLSGDVKSNVQKLRNSDYPILSFRDYYAPEVMEQVEEYLWEMTGQSPEEYRVVSLGIDPAAALYQGFYCLDGYSNNYSLEYKHAFREILEPELDRSEYLRDYFDNWGNRCYLFSAECPGYYTIEKNGFYFRDYRLNTEALAELGGDYLFSAAYIANAAEQGLTLLREEPFETEDSYYRIFVYQVEAR